MDSIKSRFWEIDCQSYGKLFANVNSDIRKLAYKGIEDESQIWILVDVLVDKIRIFVWER
jgi:hypothetical protein